MKRGRREGSSKNAGWGMLAGGHRRIEVNAEEFQAVIANGNVYACIAAQNDKTRLSSRHGSANQRSGHDLSSGAIARETPEYAMLNQA